MNNLLISDGNVQSTKGRRTMKWFRYFNKTNYNSPKDTAETFFYIVVGILIYLALRKYNII